MKILVHDYAGHPFQAQLSRALARRGHAVCHAFAGSLTGPRGSLARREGDPCSLEFRAIDLPERLDKDNLLKRRSQEREYGVLSAGLLEAWKPELVLSGNTPSEAQAHLVRFCRRSGIRFVSWVQDIYGVAAYRILSKKIPVLGSLVGRYFMWLDSVCARRSDGVVLITEDFREQMRKWRTPEDRVDVISNWAPLEDMPLHAKDNPWSRAHGLHDLKCFVYSGTLAMKHNPRLLLELALVLRERADSRVVVISEGNGVDWLKARAAERGLGNFVFLPFQPFDALPLALAAADVLVAVLEADAGAFSVPSKVLTYLCANRPLLLSVPLDNLAARTVRAAGAGVIVAPADVKAFALLGKELIDDPGRCRAMGASARQYAEEHFDIDLIADDFEGVFRKAMGSAIGIPYQAEATRALAA
jgi:colanic acid biosynthesis glycosyl transferase WcaI